MWQRVVIVMARAREPLLLIADEPTTALAVTVQAETLVLMHHLKRDTGTAVMFITHDMAVVMYCGEKFEEGPVMDIFEKSQDSYTKLLPELMQILGTKDQELMPIEITNESL